MHSNLVESGLAAVVGFASADLENKYAHNALMQNAGLALQYGCFRLAAFAFSAAKSVFFSKDYAFLGLAVAIFPFLIQVVSLSRQRFQHVELLHMLVFFCRVSVVLMWSLEIFDPPAFASKTNVALSVYEMMATCACLQIRFRHNLWLRLFALIGNQRYFVFLGLTNAWRNSLLIQMPVAIGLYICDIGQSWAWKVNFVLCEDDLGKRKQQSQSSSLAAVTLTATPSCKLLCDDDLGKLKQQSQSSALTSVSPATATSSCKQRSVTTSTSAVEHGSSRSTVLLPATTCARSQDTCATTKGMQQSRGSSSGNNLQAAPINPTDASRPPHPLPPREDNLGFLHKKYLQFRMDEYEISDVEYSATVMDVAHLGDLERVRVRDAYEVSGVEYSASVMDVADLGDLERVRMDENEVSDVEYSGTVMDAADLEYLERVRVRDAYEVSGVEYSASVMDVADLGDLERVNSMRPDFMDWNFRTGLGEQKNGL
eukprot:gene22935-30115_t